MSESPVQGKIRSDDPRLPYLFDPAFVVVYSDDVEGEEEVVGELVLRKKPLKKIKTKGQMRVAEPGEGERNAETGELFSEGNPS